jgi:hypothetical protein
VVAQRVGPGRDTAGGAWYIDWREVSDNDEPAVSRRQFFRGLGGDLLRTIGDLTGLNEEPEPAPMAVWHEGEEIVPREKQAAALSDIFSFLEQLGAEEKPEPEEPAAGAPEVASPDLAAEPEAVLPAEPAPNGEAKPPS